VKKLLAAAGLLVLGGLLGVMLAGCSHRDSSPADSSEQTLPSSEPVLGKTGGSSAARLSGDGRYFGYVRAVDAKAEPPTISFDVAQFFYGADVQRAAEEDGAVRPGEPVSNDHYERNSDTRPQNLTVANDAQATAAQPVTRLTVPREVRARCRPGCAGGIPLSLPDFFGSFEQKPAQRYSAAGDPVWVTIRNGLVVRIDEQYFP
jgi:hypothetical protein